MKNILVLWCVWLGLFGCSEPRCGDSIVDVGEECDDGNIINADNCQANCQLPKCGDGITDDENGEGCDDGNIDDGDACPSTCALAFCGDGFVERGEEECDDANGEDEDSCLSSCFLNECGDGLLNPELEICDDGNTNNNDGCDLDCSTSSIIQLTAGRANTCILLDTGSVRCWGFGFDGQLGTGDFNSVGDNELPSTLSDINVGAPVLQIATGNDHTCALLAAGVVRCWGNGLNGRLGYGNTNSIGDNESPASAGNILLGGNAVQLAAGGVHTCALLDTGVIRCWGGNFDGQLGSGNTNNIGDNEPPAESNITVDGTVIQIVGGSSHTCILFDAGQVRCWGGGSQGQLGYGNTNSIGDDELPFVAGDVIIGGPAIQLAAGSFHTCALLASGTVRCWGQGFFGQLGYGNFDSIGDDELPFVAGDVNVGGSVVQIVAGVFHTCALLDTGAVRCWGENFDGQLGYGNTNNIGDDELPFVAGDVNVGGSVVKLAARSFHTCALLDTGAVRCWGNGLDGRLGYGNQNNIGDNESPAFVGDISLF